MNNPFRKRIPTPAELLTIQLDETLRELIEHKRLNEYYSATVDMLKRRANRIRDDIRELTQETPPPNERAT